MKKMTKTSANFLIAILFLSMNSKNVSAQYCTPDADWSACAFGFNDFWITEASFAGTGSTFSYSGGNCVSNAPFYLNTNYQGDVVAGNTYTLSVSRAGNNYDTYFNVWVDWDNNLVLNNTTPNIEHIAANLFLAGSGGLTSTATITIPASIAAGVYRMRVRVEYDLTNANNPCLTTGQAETKDFSLNVISGGCVPPPVVANASSTSICEGLPVFFTGGGALTYTWSNGIVEGTPFFPLASDTYYVTGTDGNGCTSSASVLVNIIPAPVFTLSISPDTICPGESVTAVATSGTVNSYNWLPGGIVGDTVQLSPTVTSTYTCFGTNSGCNDLIQIIVPVFPAPSTPSITQAGTILTANAIGAISYQWIFAGNNINGATNNSYNALTQAGSYTVSVTDANGCSSTSATFNYSIIGIETITAGNYTIYPNPFNDFISIESRSGDYEIELINIQGSILYNQIFTKENETITTSQLAPGVYLLKIKSEKGVRISKAVKN